MREYYPTNFFILCISHLLSLILSSGQNPTTSIYIFSGSLHHHFFRPPLLRYEHLSNLKLPQQPPLKTTTYVIAITIYKVVLTCTTQPILRHFLLSFVSRYLQASPSVCRTRLASSQRTRSTSVAFKSEKFLPPMVRS